MSLDRPPSILTDVRYGAITRFVDSRGSFRELWKASTSGAIDPAAAGAPSIRIPHFVQTNLSASAAGVLRGLHFHRHQLDHWIVSSGRAFVALVDVRPMLADPEATPLVETRELVADEWLDIPTGVAHGFLALEPLELIYLVTNEYDGTDELGFAWDDPLAAIDWPIIAETTDGRPILSERDQTNPTLPELVARLRSGA